MTQREGQELVHPIKLTPRKDDYVVGGITKEEYFACQILCAIMSNEDRVRFMDTESNGVELTVRRSIKISKELIKQL